MNTPNYNELNNPALCTTDNTPASQNKTNAHIELITKKLFGIGVDSTSRLPAMLNYLDDFKSLPQVVWPVFHTCWNACDVVCEYSTELHEFLNFSMCLNGISDTRRKTSQDYLSPEDKAAFESLPKRISIYRGCSLSNVYGYSWTTDRKIAEGFARGFRGISVPNPVIASVRIPKKLALGYYTSRNESEVFIDRCEIEKYSVTVTKFQRR
jgi:hypothetical protein